jgi:MOSC domain-containing protein YiiM
MSQARDARILALALRPTAKAAMQEVSQARATAGGGLEGDVSTSADRGITLLDEEKWNQVTCELGTEIPWHTRRANVLVQGIELAQLIGKTVCLGEVEVAVKAETKPCGLMDEIHPGLRAVLEPQCRGGVYGRIVVGGTIRVGDPVSVTDSET